MGSFHSKSDMPKPVVYYTPTPTPSAPTPTVPETDTDTDAEVQERARAAAVARRRSLPETILTSFRGVLSQGSWAPQRKSLLGE